MGKFHGSTRAKLEDNGRLSLPKKFYYAIDEAERDEVYLTIENNECILAYTKSGWEERLGKPSMQGFEENPEILKKVRKLERRLKQVKIDKMGRFYLPMELKEEAGIDREIEILGTTTRFEIWSPPKLDAYEKGSESSINPEK